MPGRFRVEYADFSGGLYVGGNSTNQPMNTFRGVGAMTTPSDATVGPAPRHRLEWQSMDTAGAREYALGGAKVNAASPSAGSGVDIVGFPTARISDGRLSIVTVDVFTGAVNRQDAQVGSALAGNRWTSAAYPYQRGKNRGGFVVAGDFQAATRPNFTGVAAASAYLCYFLCELGAAQITCAVIPETLHTVARWNSRFYGASITNGSRLWFTDFGGTSIPSTNFIDIDSAAGEPITALVPSLSGLYIGKPSGWWLLTGVPGDTAFVHDLGNVAIGPRTNHAALTDFGVMFSEPFTGVSVHAQNGNDLRAIVYDKPARTYTITDGFSLGARGPVDLGAGCVGAVAQPPIEWGNPSVTNSPNTCSVADDHALIYERGRWRMAPTYTDAPIPWAPSNTATVFGDGTGGTRVPKLFDFCTGLNGSNASVEDAAYGYVLVSDGATAGVGVQRGWEIWGYPLYVPPWGTQTVYDEQPTTQLAETTVELAEWRKASAGNQPMTCSLFEAYAEVEKVVETYDPAVLGGTRTPLDSVCFIELRVRTRGIVGEQTGVDGGYSTSDRWEAPSAVLGGPLGSQRQFVRLGVSSGPGQAFTPEVTLHGLILRRLVLVMTDGSAP